MATVTVDTVTDPISTLNDTAVTASGTNTALDTVSIKIVDSAGASITAPATVTGTGWALPATDVSSLADGTLIFEATSTDLSGGKAFAAKAAQKSTTSPGYITEQELRNALHDSSSLDSTLLQGAILAASEAVNTRCGRKFYQRLDTQYFFPDDLWTVSLDDMDLATTTGLSVHVDDGYAGTFTEARVFGTDFICEPRNQSVYGVEGWPFTSLKAISGKTWFLRYTDFQQYTVKVTGTWGWPAVPYSVKQATTIVAAFLYKRPEAALGMTALPEIGMMRVRDPDVDALLRNFQKQSTKFLVA